MSYELNMVKLHITYKEPQDGFYGESLWATPLKNGYFRIENHPLIEDLAFGDIVKAALIDGYLEFECFVMRDVSKD